MRLGVERHAIGAPGHDAVLDLLVAVERVRQDQANDEQDNDNAKRDHRAALGAILAVVIGHLPKLCRSFELLKPCGHVDWRTRESRPGKNEPARDGRLGRARGPRGAFRFGSGVVEAVLPIAVRGPVPVAEGLEPPDKARIRLFQGCHGDLLS